MKNAFDKINNYKADHSRFGGKIYYSDFNTDYRGRTNDNGSTIACRIAQDMKFDQQCRTNIENKAV